MEGPFIVLPTQRGSVVGLTATQANEILHEDEKWISVSAFDATELIAPVKKAKLPLNVFCGLPGYKTVLTLRNCFHGLHASAASSDNAISANHEKGRVTLKKDTWVDIVTAIKPEVAVCPCDTVPLCETSERKRKTASIRNSNWEALATQTLCSKILLPDTYHTSEAFFVSTLPANENIREYAFNLGQIRSKRPRAVCLTSVNSFFHFITALKNEITFIECSLPWNLAEKGIALNPKIDGPGEVEEGSSSSSFLLELRDHKYQLEAVPLQKNCGCYTCRRHTRAYIHHLLTVQEMNSNILLVIHNLSVVVKIARKFRIGSAKERSELIQLLTSQC